MSEISSKFPTVTIDTIMTSNVFSVHVSMTIREAIQVLVSNKISGAPVLDSAGTVVSVVSEGSLLKLATKKGTSETIGLCLEELPPTSQLIVAHRTEIVSRSNILRMLVQVA